jgi:hypothetical protein
MIERIRIQLLSISKTLKEVNDANLTYVSYYDKAEKEIYTLDKNTIYKGPLDNPKKTSFHAFESDQNTWGRGSGSQDDFALIPNMTKSRIIYLNTFNPTIFSTETESPSSDKYFGGFIVLSKLGEVILESPATFKPKWIDDTSILAFVYQDGSETVVIRKYTFDLEDKYTYVDLVKITDSNVFGSIYNLDTIGNKALITAEKEDDHLTYTLDLSDSSSQPVKLNINTAMNYFVSENLLIGFETIPCEGSPGEGELSCPGDGPFMQFKTKIITYNLLTGEQKTQLVYENPRIL